MSMLDACHHYFHRAADALELADKVRTILITPHRSVAVEIVTETDEGELAPDPFLFQPACQLGQVHL